MNTEERSAITYIWALILLIAVTIAGFGLFYLFFQTTTTYAEKVAAFSIDAKISQTAQGTSLFILSITNTGSVSITGISVSFPSGSPLCVPTLNHNGVPVSDTNPVPSGSGADGICIAGSVAAGQSYGLTLSVTFQNGKTVAQPWNVEA